MKSAHFHRSAFVLPAILGLGLGSSAQAQLNSTQKADVGFTALQEKLGLSMPTGAGVSVSQVEAQEPSTNYRPNAGAFPTKTFVYGSGGSTGASSHATTVGQYFYGTSSLSPGIGVSPNRITSFEAGGFLGGNFLNTTNTGQLPAVELNDVQNHSWVGTTGNAATDIDALRRIDHAIQRDDFVAVFGLNNGSGTSVPNLMAGAYNGITVGLSNGAHSRNGITLDGGARTRPDIVVPTSATSWAAPTVGGAAALLIETARTTPGLGNADRSIAVKSLLMTGATREEAEFGRAWANTTTQPLDSVFGAGELDVLHSHDILVSGEKNASGSSTVSSVGWDLGTSSATVPQTYFFDLSSSGLDFQVAASLVWNRDVAAVDSQPGPGVSLAFTPNLANLNLRLFSADGFTLGSEIATSVSDTTNVELIVAKDLAPGRYAWQISSDTNSVAYGFSWNVEGFVPIPEPSAAGLVFAGILLIGLRRRTGSAHS